MSITRQFVACKFRSEDKRSYTYHNDGEPLAVGDFAKVMDRSGDGWKRVEVVSIADQAPPFPTKPILEKLDPEPHPSRETLDLGGDAELAPTF